MDFLNEGKTGKVKLQAIFDDIYEDCDSALADYFYKGLKFKMDDEGCIDLADAEVQLYIEWNVLKYMKIFIMQLC